MLSAEGNIPQIDRWDESTRGIFHASANHLALPDAYEFRLLERNVMKKRIARTRVDDCRPPKALIRPQRNCTQAACPGSRRGGNGSRRARESI
eukprot:5827820-Pyramimonas_sp.AAC.2